MITAIDEVGNFGLESDDLHYFVAVHIDQNQKRLPIKQSQFRLWEDNIPSIHRENGEVKGRLLGDEQLSAFFEHVITAEPKVLISAVGTVPRRNTPNAVAKHVRNEVVALTRVIEHHAERGHVSSAKAWHERTIPLDGHKYHTGGVVTFKNGLALRASSCLDTTTFTENVAESPPTSAADCPML